MQIYEKKNSEDTRFISPFKKGEDRAGGGTSAHPSNALRKRKSKRVLAALGHTSVGVHLAKKKDRAGDGPITHPSNALRKKKNHSW